MSPIAAMARAVAVVAHGDQRYGAHPYSVHLDAVADVLVEHNLDHDELVAAAYLHDVLEDTHTREEHLVSAGFSRRTVDLVKAVTNEPGKNRAERAAATYPKIRATPYAIALKLADRIANVEASRVSGSNLLQMYRREASGFRAALFVVDEWSGLWERLDRALSPLGGEGEPTP